MTSIENGTFTGCWNLKEVQIPTSVTTIKDYAFEKCKSLKGITIPNSVTSIGVSAFEYCESLQDIKLPIKLKVIREGTFYKCKNLRNISISSEVNSIRAGAFCGCRSLENIKIPTSVTGNEMSNIVKAYDKLGKRNRKKDDNHLNKHAMHLVRLFMMAIDILEKGKVNTYRKKEQQLLLSIRRGDYQKVDGTFRDEFYEMVSEYEKKLDYAAKNTILPDEPDMKRVQEYVMSVNEKVVKDEI